MKREMQLQYCSKCKNRVMDLKQGLICNLTGEKASFEGECKDFDFDKNVKDRNIDVDAEVGINQVMDILPEDYIKRLRTEQNLLDSLIGGSLVGLLGAVLWGVVTVVTEHQIGIIALAIGAGVGYSIRYLGKGIDKIFGIWGAIIAFLSCLTGNFFSIVGFIANDQGLGYVETLFLINYSYIPELMAETFHILDLLFYGIAIYWGFRFSFRHISEMELSEIAKNNTI